MINTTKKILSLILGLTLALTNGSIAFASETGQGATADTEMTYSNNIPYEEVKDMSELSIEEKEKLIDEIVKDILGNSPEPTNLEKNQVKDIIQQQEQNRSAAKKVDDDYKKNSILLRTGNVIEFSLNAAEGMTNKQQATAVNQGSVAKNLSEDQYPKDDNLQDAYRHYSWNWLMSKNLNKNKARTAANNHEWGLILIDPVLKIYEQKYTLYISQGKTVSKAAAAALVDALAYAPNAKSSVISQVRNNYSKFKTFFTNDNIMDLVNNCYGRAAYPAKSYFSGFINDLDSGNLIKAASKVKDDHKYLVWSSDWYGY